MAPVVSPATEEVLTTVAKPTVADADRAVAAARQAFDSGPWPRLPVADRVAVCGRLCDALERRLDVLN
ncbi:MAG: aldehyde dehydrogenase family protein, partial [Gammaproteobacteria bacterium]|nr:aldehyde dehydrogenase family protein [Gammaproteobacteria bacterium]